MKYLILVFQNVIQQYLSLFKYFDEMLAITSILIILPIKIPLEFLFYLFDTYIDKRISLIYPEANIPLEHYGDYHDSLKYKNHLAYRLGSAFLQKPLTFIFKIPSIYKAYKLKKGR